MESHSSKLEFDWTIELWFAYGDVDFAIICHNVIPCSIKMCFRGIDILSREISFQKKFGSRKEKGSLKSCLSCENGKKKTKQKNKTKTKKKNNNKTTKCI